MDWTISLNNQRRTQFAAPSSAVASRRESLEAALTVRNDEQMTMTYDRFHDSSAFLLMFTR